MHGHPVDGGECRSDVHSLMLSSRDELLPHSRPADSIIWCVTVIQSGRDEGMDYSLRVLF